MIAALYEEDICLSTSSLKDTKLIWTLAFCSRPVSDLPKTSAFSCAIFADDTVLFISSRNCIELQKVVNTESQKVESLNYSKTSYLFIGPRGKRLHDFT